ncbi:hypothetical protein FD755_019608 [Muntiacus reevesi]|uniref:NADH dehydrogenase [ubiquinone] 1 beta subcomplex subunit 6 n=1 Tax=Muntiacus reevesi TaxID=9886 RepID=A0A5N3X4K8_MUNRE|nr:hypothetical protein FD755_019608 [Muntiacus reevesi]
MSGYTPDEKLRLQQLRELRRRWLKDQELSPREPVLPPQRVSPVERFWNKFLQDGALWKNLIYKTYRHSIFAFTHVLIPVWIIHYYLKYHVTVSIPEACRIFPDQGSNPLEWKESGDSCLPSLEFYNPKSEEDILVHSDEC